MKLRVLITNNTLGPRKGTELYVRDLATALLARGHTPIAFSTELGEVARELRAETVPVVQSLDALGEPPHIIHGQHHAETMAALLHFPGVPAVFFCHSWTTWADMPPNFPRILRYVAIDQTVRDRLVLEHSVSAELVRILPNFVDLARFRPRTPLPTRPARALIFSNYAGEDNYLGPVREACERSGLRLDVIGSGVGNESAEPEKVLGEYDLVFAKGRAALEAMAVGAAVVLCDAPGLGPMVTSGDVERLRSMNFDIRALRSPHDAGLVAREIARYDAADAARVSRLIRETASRELVVDEIVSLYEEVIAEYGARDADDARAEGRAAARYLLGQKAIFDSEAAATTRIRERIERLPLLGGLGVKLARAISGRRR